MTVVDASAIVAILTGEPEASALTAALARASGPRLSGAALPYKGGDFSKADIESAS